MTGGTIYFCPPGSWDCILIVQSSRHPNTKLKGGEVDRWTTRAEITTTTVTRTSVVILSIPIGRIKTRENWRHHCQLRSCQKWSRCIGVNTEVEIVVR